MGRESLRLESVLDYELRNCVRYQRSLSLVMISSVKGSVEVGELLWPVLRDSDKFCTFERRGAIVMGQTDRAGALAAIERYRNRCNAEVDLRFGVACFPEDACTVHELVATAKQRLEKAVKLERGAAVATG